MKKKYSLVLIVLAVMFCLTGCEFSFFNNNSSFRTFSYESKYSAPITISGATNHTEIAEPLLDSCVTICTESVKTTKNVSFGSGVCIYAGGYIVTNNHVVDSYMSNKLSYNLKTYLNGSYTGLATKVLWRSEELDLAIVQCNEPDVPFVKMVDRAINCQSSEKLRILEQVIAIGTPIDFSLQNWCSVGEISKLNCYTTSDGNLYENLIGHTASINHGNSGGGLFDLAGNLVGLNTLGDDDANSIFFAVPVYPVMQVIEKVVSANEQVKASLVKIPVIGLSIYDGIMGYYSDKTFSINKQGVCVSTIAENGPCENVLLKDDIITKLTVGSKEYNIQNRCYFIYALISCDIGDSVTLTIKRDGEEITKTVTLVESIPVKE